MAASSQLPMVGPLPSRRSHALFSFLQRAARAGSSFPWGRRPAQGCSPTPQPWRPSSPRSASALPLPSSSSHKQQQRLSPAARQATARPPLPPMVPRNSSSKDSTAAAARPSSPRWRKPLPWRAAADALEHPRHGSRPGFLPICVLLRSAPSVLAMCSTKCAASYTPSISCSSPDVSSRLAALC
jgi:hypothetical protein